MGRIIVISGPSGSGKTSICTKLLNILPELAYSVSATTRKKRENEKDGVDYYFIDKTKFQQMLDNKEFIEWEEVHDNLYGTLLSDIKKKRNENIGVLMDIDPKGGINIKKSFPDSVLIFLSVPSIDTLIERLKNRGNEKDFDIDKRIERVKEEFKLSEKYDFIIVNEDIDTAIEKILDIIKEKIFTDEEHIKK